MKLHGTIPSEIGRLEKIRELRPVLLYIHIIRLVTHVSVSVVMNAYRHTLAPEQ